MATDWPPMNERGPQVTEAQIGEFETLLHQRLPADYRKFLIEVNGGQPDVNHCEFVHGTVNSLFGLSDADDANSLAIRAERARSALPSSYLLFIGHNEYGGRILLALEGEHRGEVWMMLTTDARPDDANPRVLWHDRRDMTKLADSFSEFMHSLRPLRVIRTW